MAWRLFFTRSQGRSRENLRMRGLECVMEYLDTIQRRELPISVIRRRRGKKGEKPPKGWPCMNEILPSVLCCRRRNKACAILCARGWKLLHWLLAPLAPSREKERARERECFVYRVRVCRCKHRRESPIRSERTKERERERKVNTLGDRCRNVWCHVLFAFVNLYTCQSATRDENKKSLKTESNLQLKHENVNFVAKIKRFSILIRVRWWWKWETTSWPWQQSTARTVNVFLIIFQLFPESLFVCLLVNVFKIIRFFLQCSRRRRDRTSSSENCTRERKDGGGSGSRMVKGDLRDPASLGLPPTRQLCVLSPEQKTASWFSFYAK